MNTIFFDTGSYFIHKKRRGSASQFRIYNNRRECIGYIMQGKAISEKNKKMNVFSEVFEIRNANGVLKVSLSRYRFIFCPEIVIKDAEGKKVGSIIQQFSFFKHSFKILNSSCEVIAIIYRNRKDLCFTISGVAQNEFGEIKQRGDSIRSWNKFDVLMDEVYIKVEDKIAILSSALAINVVL